MSNYVRMNSQRLLSHYKTWMFLALFIIVLFGLRVVWYMDNAVGDQPIAENGVLDVRHWKFDNQNTIYLNGQWEFYPNQLLDRDSISAGQGGEPVLISVPGTWKEALPAGSTDHYGYGTYRLRILLGEPIHPAYRIWVQRIEAASVLEINGVTMSPIGRITADEQSYIPDNRSYTDRFDSEGAVEVELIIRVANFDSPTKGGIIESIRFGTEAAVDFERMYSIGFQMIAYVILMLHALYAGILFLLNSRNKVFLVFFLLLFFAGLTIVSDDDSLLRLWLSLNYTWSLKFRFLAYLWVAFFMVLLTRSFSATRTTGIGFRMYAAALCLYTLFLLASPINAVMYANDTFRPLLLLYLLPTLWVLYRIASMLRSNREDVIFLLIASTSIVSSISWGVITGILKLYPTYYPLDIIGALIGFSSYWFKRYFRNTEENAKLTEQLQQADKLKDQFLANTSHELRTPLHGMLSIAQTIAANEQQTLSKKSAQDLDLLLTIGRRMSHLVNDLLDMVLLKDQQIVLQREPLQLQSIASGVIDMLQFMVRSKSVRLQLNLSDKMPPVYADEKRLMQILINLVHNAIKFTEQGTITIAAEIQMGQAIITVTDTGTGMDEETQRRIFTPYEQGDQHLGNSSGIGLGLSICKQLVELHGGSIGVISKPGEGSSFSFQLPLYDPSRSDAPNRTDTVAAIAKSPAQSLTSSQDTGSHSEVWQPMAHSKPMIAAGNVHILAVDDDAVNLQVLASILSGPQYSIHTVLSGKEALELLHTRRWDLLISDVMMPYMSGYELTRQIREHYTLSELPVLLLTARSAPEDIYTGFLAGANDYVAKPVDALELKYRVWALTSLKQSVSDSLRMEAAYLQAQIQPHFLFNTLNALLALSDLDPERMRSLGEALIAYLRISFDFLNSEQLVPLSHELELVQAYLYIEQERFQDRLSVIWQVEPNIELMLPPLSIQPLVENAVKHGLLQQARGGTVEIILKRIEEGIRVEVRDNGKGMEPEYALHLLDASRRGAGGIGLLNTNRRLTQLYGRGLAIQSKPGEGTSVTFVIPRTEAPA